MSKITIIELTEVELITLVEWFKYAENQVNFFKSDYDLVNKLYREWRKLQNEAK